jgi:C-terminal processing protease CtpA/Prc
MALRVRAIGAFAFLFLALVAPSFFADSPQHKLNTRDAERLRVILHDAYDDVKKNYYDTNFHGLDWEKLYQGYRERMKDLNSLDEGLTLIAGFLDALNDSHTYFIPPQQNIRANYGFQMIMVGDKPLVLRVRPGTDAESKVRAGDEIVTYNRVTVKRDSLWRVEYYYNVLSPQRGTSLVLRSLEGQQHEVDVAASIQEFQRGVTRDDLFNRLRLSESADHRVRQRYQEIDDVLIWKLPNFFVQEISIDHVFSIARKHKALILDLRENPGGSVRIAEDMIANLFEQDVKIADRRGRKESKPEYAKGRGKSAFTGKLIVIVDSKSASASEILARVVQLEHRGTVIGDRTSGHVMEGEIMVDQQSDAGRIRYGFSVTIADLIMKDGKSLEHFGVTPDEIVLPTATDVATSRDPVLSRAAALAGLELGPVEAGKLFPYEWLPMWP